MISKKKYSKQKIRERFGKALQQLGKKNVYVSDKEVAEDVKKAVVEVRAGEKILEQ